MDLKIVKKNRLKEIVTHQDSNKTFTVSSKEVKDESIIELENGGKIKLSNIKYKTIPNFCPKCNRIMNSRADKSIYNKLGHCLNCQSEFESKLQINGKFKEYEQKIIKLNQKFEIQSFEEYIYEYVDSLNSDNLINNEFGDIEKNDKLDVTKMKEQIKEEINKLKAEL